MRLTTIVFILVLAISSTGADGPLRWVDCENPPARPRPQYVSPGGYVYDRGWNYQITPSHLSRNFEQLLDYLADQLFMKELTEAFKPYEIEILFDAVKHWEEGGSSNHPEPMFAIKALVQKVMDLRLHCTSYIRGSMIDLEFANKLVKLDEVDLSGWVVNDRGVVTPVESEFDPDTLHMDTYSTGDFDDDLEGDSVIPLMQYVNNSNAKILLILVTDFINQASQLRNMLIVTSKSLDVSPFRVFTLLAQIKAWKGVYKKLEKFTKAVEIFREEAPILSKRPIKRGELRELAAGRRTRGLSDKARMGLLDCWEGICRAANKITTIVEDDQDSDVRELFEPGDSELTPRYEDVERDISFREQGQDQDNEESMVDSEEEEDTKVEVIDLEAARQNRP